MHMHVNVHFNAGTLYYTKKSGKPSLRKTIYFWIVKQCAEINSN